MITGTSETGGSEKQATGREVTFLVILLTKVKTDSGRKLTHQDLK